MPNRRLSRRPPMELACVPAKPALETGLGFVKYLPNFVVGWSEIEDGPTN